MKRAILLPLLSLAVFAPTATAVEETGRGDAIEHVKNIAYPNLNAEDEVNAGTDIEFAKIRVPAANRPSGEARRFAFAGSYGDGLQIVDISNPKKAKLVSTWDCGVSQGDVQVFRRNDLGGRWFVTYTHDDGYNFHLDSQCAEDLKTMGIDVTAVPPPEDPDGQIWTPESFYGAGTFIADVTDPYNPKTVSFVPVQPWARTTRPCTRRGKLPLQLELRPDHERPAVRSRSFDISDITDPKVVGEVALKTLPGLAPSRTTSSSPRTARARYVAALSHGEILDTTRPREPRLDRDGRRPGDQRLAPDGGRDDRGPDPRASGGFLIAEDEVAGASGTGQCPNGGVHVYDITGDLEQAPVKVGMWNIDDVGLTDNGLGTCTAHVFQVHEKEKLMTIAFYNGGVRVVDLSGLVGVALGENGVGMKQLGWYRFADGDTWSVKAPFVSRDGFYMYGNDHARGFDVYKWTPAAAGESVSAGQWLNAKQALNASRQIGAGAKARQRVHPARLSGHPRCRGR